MKKFFILFPIFLFVVLQAKAQWSYGSYTNSMTDKTESYAVVKSLNKVNFSFPYEGGSTFKLIVFNNHQIQLIASKGQFLYGGYLLLKFDDSKPRTLGCSLPSDGSADEVIFVVGHRIIKEMRNHTILRIEAPFYQDGRKIIEFNISNYKY